MSLKQKKKKFKPRIKLNHNIHKDSPIERFHSPTWPAGMQITGPNERFMEKVQQSIKGLVWDTYMAVVSLFWDSDMVDVTLSENALQD